MNRTLRWSGIAAVVAGLALLASPLTSSGSAASSKTLVVAETTDPVSLNPLQQRVTATYGLLRNLYDPLIDFADQGLKYNSFTPVLATSWKQISPTAVRFTLRKGVKFSGGQPFDSQSVVYSVKALLGKLPHSQPSLAAFLFPSLTKAVANGQYSVTLYTKAPTPGLLASLTQLLIVPQGSSTSQSGTLSRTPDGTGPYVMTSYTPDQSLKMTAKPNYFLGPAKIKNIDWETIPQDSSTLAGLLSGSVNLDFGLSPTDVSSVERSATNKVVTVPSTRVAAIWLNTLSVKPLESQLVRQALNYAIDKQALLKSPLSGLAEPVANIVPSYFAGYNSAPKPYPYNPTKAKALLKQAGYPNGFPLTIMVPSTHYVLGTQVVQVIASELQQVGIKTSIDQVSFSNFATVTAKRTIPASFYGAWGSTYPDPLQMFQTIVLGGTTGFSWFNDPAVNKLIDSAATATSTSAYDNDLKQVQTQIQTKAPFIYLFVYKDAWGLSKGLSWSPPPTEVEYMYYASWK